MSLLGRLAQFVSVFSKLNRGVKSSCQWGYWASSSRSQLVDHACLHNSWQNNLKTHSSRLILSGIAIAVATNKVDQTSADEEKIIHLIKLAKLSQQVQLKYKYGKLTHNTAFYHCYDSMLFYVYINLIYISILTFVRKIEYLDNTTRASKD